MPKAQQTADLSVELFEKLLVESRPAKSRLYLWGGEPFVHRHFGKILELLQIEDREVVICTNAYFIDKHIDVVCKMGRNIEFLIALEGFEEAHDAIRGEGSFAKVIGQIENLLRLRSEGLFGGEISVHCVINNGMVGRLFEFTKYLEDLGVDLIILCFPWYISHETSKEMDAYVSENLEWAMTPGGKHSWDAFKYKFGSEMVPALMADLREINERVWETKVRYQPGLEFEEIESFVNGEAMNAKCATSCSVLNTRIDIFPDGTASACKFFSELSVGDLRTEGLADIWNSERYQAIREALGKKLSPACSKCSALYLHAHSNAVFV